MNNVGEIRVHLRAGAVRATLDGDEGVERRFSVALEADTRIAVHCMAGAKLRWATLELVEALSAEAKYVPRTEPLPPGYDSPGAPQDDDWDECTTCGQSRWADHATGCLLARKRYQWVVRRFDWFDPTPERDPSFKQAVMADELRELLAILDGLNGAVKEKDWSNLVPPDGQRR